MNLILNHDVRGMCNNEDITRNTSLVQFNTFTGAIGIGDVPRMLISIGTLYNHNSSRFENCMANILTEEWCMYVLESSNIHGIMHNVVRNKLSTFGPHAILAITVSLPNNFNLRHDFGGGRTGVKTLMTNTPFIIFRISVDDALEYLEHGIGGIHNVGFSFRSSFDYLNYAIIPRYGYCTMDTMMKILHCLQYAEDNFECVLEIQDRFELFMQERTDLIREDIKRKTVVSDTHKIGFIKSRVEELSISGGIINTRRMGSPLCSILEEEGKPENLQSNEINQYCCSDE